MLGSGANGKKPIKEVEKLRAHKPKLERVGSNSTERKKAKKALLRERDKAQKYLDVAGVMLVAIDAEQRVGLINKKGREILGYKEEEILGKNWFDNFLPERIRSQVKAVFKKVVRAEADASEYYENPILTKSGDERLIAWHNTILRAEQGDIIGTLSSGEDITERKKAEEVIWASESEKRSILNAISDVVLFQDTDLTVRWCNEAAARTIGMTQRELIGCYCYELWHGRSEPCEQCPVLRAIETGSHTESIMTTPDGKWWEIIGEPVCDMDGKIKGAIEIARDITERKRAEEALKESEDKFKSIFEHANDGVIYLDTSGTILDINKKAVQMFGGLKQQAVNKHFTEVGIFPADEIPTLMSNFEKIFSGEEVVLTVPIKNKKGHEIILECSASLTKTDDGAGRIMVIARDITERIKASEQIAKLAKFPAENPNPVVRISGRGTVIFANKASAILLKTWDCRVGKSLPEPWHDLVMDSLSSGQSQQTEVQCDGRTFSLIFAPVEKANYVNIYGLDISERKKAEEKLLEHQAKLKAMASEMLVTEERERQRLAVGLHDEVCQKLVLTKLALESSMNLVSDSKVLASLRIVCEGIGETIEQADSLTFELSNPVLRQLGFVIALEKYLTEEIRQKHGIEYELESDEQLGTLQDEIKNCLFRVTRELLTNVVKHAHARKVKVSVRESQSQIYVRVQDDGVGFKESQANSKVSKTTRFGLFSIREQLEYLGGHLEIESKPGQGTTATVVVPLRGKAIV